MIKSYLFPTKKTKYKMKIESAEIRWMEREVAGGADWKGVLI
jgi:hypothetical protein